MSQDAASKQARAATLRRAAKRQIQALDEQIRELEARKARFEAVVVDQAVLEALAEGTMNGYSEHANGEHVDEEQVRAIALRALSASAPSRTSHIEQALEREGITLPRDRLLPILQGSARIETAGRGWWRLP